MREVDWKDDALSSKMLRKRFRDEKKVIEKGEAEVKDLQKRSSLAIPIVPEVEEDIHSAKRIKYAGFLPSFLLPQNYYFYVLLLLTFSFADL
jgi:hypothetical protein